MIPFDRIDLNLLRVFDAVMEERSVLRASQRLRLSQSALSHALSRLRESLGEEIFVRTCKGMTPTDYAFSISVPLRTALQSMSSALARAASPFHAPTARRSFTVAANDYASAILMPHLNQVLAKVAPGIDLVIRPSTRLDLAEQIDLGRIDIAIGMFRSIPDRLRSQLLIQQDEVLIMWKKHPIATRKINLEDLSRHSIVVVSLGGEEDGAVKGFILERGLARQSEMYDRFALENALQEITLTPRKQVIIPHFLVIPMLIENSNLLSIVPRPLAEVFSKTYPILVQELPYQVSSQRMDIVWHSHNDIDPAQCWLRSLVGEIAIGIKGVTASNLGSV
ncbi:LysR family transcriptional regulator [Undibacterium sp. TJN25]|uniref:LysR family transcriptional regulator n=1 Tax=Undibacterium sp. TJN25 TaxID=3413056 RepID=UPI003BF0A456